MKYLFTAMIVVSAVYGMISGNTEAVSNAVLEEGVNAVELSMYMLGGMCVWGGIMRVAEKSGITDFICRIFSIYLYYNTVNFMLNYCRFTAADYQ